jgi:hypothetical protein
MGPNLSQLHPPPILVTSVTTIAIIYIKQFIDYGVCNFIYLHATFTYVAPIINYCHQTTNSNRRNNVFKIFHVFKIRSRYKAGFPFA